METVYNLLHKNENLSKIPKTDLEKRRIVIFNEIFVQIYKRMNVALLFEDKIVFASKLVEVKLGQSCYMNNFLQLFKSSTLVLGSLSPDILEGKLTPIQLKNLESLSENEKFNGLISHITKNQDLWLNFLNSENPENQIPEGW